ncbi:PH domain-containing protein [Planotetraspora mira]|nr:PH domain-containing protein [Planotetraspora mira]
MAEKVIMMLPELFLPRPSRGYLSLAVVTALLGFAAATNLTAGTFAEILFGLGLALVAAYLLALALCFPLMRYVVSETTLTAKYGPLLRYRIRLSDITSVTSSHLAQDSAAALAMPGIALYGMRCAGLGRVRMCATRPSNNVLVIGTRDGTRYGVTPADERAFRDALRRHGVPVGP